MSRTPYTSPLNPQRFSASTREALDAARTRLLMVSALFIFALCAICYRLVDLTLLTPGHEPKLLDQTSRDFATGRAELRDRNGKLLATTVTTSSVYANAKKILDPQEAARKLSKAFPKLSYEALLKQFKSQRTFIWVLRHLTPEQKAKILHLGIPGLNFVHDHRRIYPYDALMSHVVGFTDVDNRGISGVEKKLDQQLRSSTKPIYLSLDVIFQNIVREELLKGMEEFQAIAGSGTLMDIETGQILAMVSLPDFDPHHPTKSTEEQRFNKNTLGIYEIGSIAKVINTAMVLDTGTASLNTIVDTSAPLKVGRFTITDYRANHGRISVAEVFVRSSNKGSARLALAAGADRQKDFFYRIGLFGPTGIELPELGFPKIPRRWRDATVISASYGYGFSVSPLKILETIVSLTKGTKTTSTLLLEKKAASEERIVSPETSRIMRQLMRLVVTQGTATKANVPGYFVAGKTGTAKLLLNGHYHGKRSSTAFLGLLGESADRPKYALIVRMDDPKGMPHTYGFNTAGWNSAAVSGRIFERIATVSGLHPQEPQARPLDPLFHHVTFSKQKD